MIYLKEVSSVEEMALLGAFEELVLMAVNNFGDHAYGVPVRRAVEAATGRVTSIGAIYTTLDRLEQKGYVRHEMGAPTAERGGRAKKYFVIQGAGISALQNMARVRQVMTQGKLLPDLGAA